ncbi:MAG TPA: hypothetical protein V6C91_19705 [Coleofasciculaceae cyanobacterium]
MVKSFHEQNIEAFIDLLKSQRSLFSAQDRTSLEQLIATLPDDEEKISEALASWYEKHPKILDEQLDILNDMLTNALNSSQIVSRALSRSNEQDDENYRDRLLNAIKASAR